jgi:hypothetical protein
MPNKTKRPDAHALDQPEKSPPAAPERHGADLTAEPKPHKSPVMPNERDESAGMTDGKPDTRIAKGHDDLKRGVEDTSGGGQTDAAYRKLKQ